MVAERVTDTEIASKAHPDLIRGLVRQHILAALPHDQAEMVMAQRRASKHLIVYPTDLWESETERLAAARDDARRLIPLELIALRAGMPQETPDLLRYMEAPAPDAITPDDLLGSLEAHNARLCQRYVFYLAMRYTAGTSVVTIATALGRAPRTLRKDVQQAEEFLVAEVGRRLVVDIQAKQQAPPQGCGEQT